MNSVNLSLKYRDVPDDLLAESAEGLIGCWHSGILSPFLIYQNFASLVIPERLASLNLSQVFN
jgi:hypothetical protein